MVTQQANKSCKFCHEKKSKCDLSEGGPCSRCIENRVVCERRVRKPYATRKRNTKLSSSKSPLLIHIDDARANTTLEHQTDIAHTKAFAEAVFNPRNQPEREKFDHFFIGDQQGIGSLLSATLHSQQTHVQHLLVPRATVSVLQQEDLEYLAKKGCFSFPNSSICDSLIESYIRQVHFTFPVIDIDAFTITLIGKGLQGINLLLLWSVFSSGASYVDDAVVCQAGFKTKKDLKESYLKRAQALFHLSKEDDKIILIQSALLISFWFSDPADVAQSWFWSGMAISLAQTIGLHRNPDLTKFNTSLSASKRRLWRRLWWCCVQRDAWLALGMGRPLRINDADCDCRVPTIEDLLSDGYSGNNGSDSVDLAHLWIKLVELTKLLRQVLILNFRGQSLHTTTPVQILEYQMNETTKVIVREQQSRFSQFQALHLELHKQAAIIALFRPFLASKSVHGQPVPPHTAMNKVKEAASAIHRIVEKIIETDSVNFIAPQTIPLIVPAMQFFLLELRSAKPLAVAFANSRLDICSTLLQELEENYPAASVIKQLFYSARAQVTCTINDKTDANVNMGADADGDAEQTPPENASTSDLGRPSGTGSLAGALVLPGDETSGFLLTEDPFTFTTIHDVWSANPAASVTSRESDLNAWFDLDELGDFFDYSK